MEGQERRQSRGRESNYKALLAKAALLRQIGELPEERINPSSAVFIAGQLIARAVEERYLEGYMGDPEKGETSATQASKGETGKLQAILQDSQAGDFRGLKGFIKDAAEDWRVIAETDDEPNSEEFEADMNISKNLGLIEESMPESGDGSIIMIPLPAAMQEPQPLEQQLARYGGETNL